MMRCLTTTAVVYGIPTLTPIANAQNSRDEIEKQMRAAIPASATCERFADASLCKEETNQYEIIFGRGDIKESGPDDIIRIMLPTPNYNLTPQQEAVVISSFTNFGFPESEVKTCTVAIRSADAAQNQCIIFRETKFGLLVYRSDDRWPFGKAINSDLTDLPLAHAGVHGGSPCRPRSCVGS